MCGLFGFSSYGDCIKQSDMSNLLASLGCNSCERGIDATGIAYNKNNDMVIRKQAKPAYDFNFILPDKTNVVIGHTRQTTQGSQKKCYNNHPFKSVCGGENFALAHNGIIFNESELRKKFHIPQTKIETDSYVAVQMLELYRDLTLNTINDMAEKIEGSFCFTILDKMDNLYLVRGNNPLSVIHLKRIKLFIYASTDQILLKSVIYSNLYSQFKKMILNHPREFEFVKINPGSILKIGRNGTIERKTINMSEYAIFNKYRKQIDKYNFRLEDFDYI